VSGPTSQLRASRRALAAGAVLLALATAIGALGAHALKGRLPADSYAVLQTAVQYQFFNALGLLVVGTLLGGAANSALCLAADLLLAGVLLFCGSLYALLCGAPRALGLLTPLGGLALISGWCVAAVALWRARAPSA
jgi:uncharacterized membrane protein YgdD (TMEM256/DUF423 family)